MAKQPESGEYPATLICPRCETENTLDSKFCKECGHWLVGEWKGIGFRKVRLQRIGWQWVALAAAVGIIIGVLIGIAVSGGF